MRRNFLYRIKKTSIFGVLVLGIISCSEPPQKTVATASLLALDYSIDTSAIPQDTVFTTDTLVSLQNGLYYFNNKPFSGIVVKHLSKVVITSYISVLNGKLHGTYRSFFASGKPYEVRSYRNNLAVGKHYGFWRETHNLNFEFNYYEDKREGTQKSWYRNGAPFMVKRYKQDALEGLQQAWRKNGLLYINYVAKNGRKYGMQRASLCYQVEEEQVN